MVDAFTRRNHYNPCFWTSLWNTAYFEAFVQGIPTTIPPRDQRVVALNIRSGRIYQTTVERVHYDKGLGVAEITPESVKRFCRRWFPAEYDRIARHIEDNPENLYIDFEEVLAGVEEKGKYDSLLEAARIGGFSTEEHKGFVTCILIIHAMRSHELMSSMVEMTTSLGLAKWEYFWLLKNAWSNPLVLARAVTPLALSQWILYRTKSHRFPLCDSPVMINRDTLMAVLSPRLLLEIQLNVSPNEDQCMVRDGISSSKYREFRRRSIANSYKEIIFCDADELERWRALPEFASRSTELSCQVTRRGVIAQGANRVIWALEGFGRVPQDFEARVSHIFKV